MNKKSLLVFLLSLVLVFCVCAGAFGGTVSATVSIPDFSSDAYTDLVPMSGLTSADSVAVSLDAAAGSYLNCTTNSGDHRNFVPLTSGMAATATKFYGCGSITYNTSTYAPNAAGHCSYVPLALISAHDAGDYTDYYMVLQFYGAGAQARFGVVWEGGEHNGWRFDYISSVTTNIGDTHTFKYALDTADLTLSMVIDGNTVIEDFKATSKGSFDTMVPLAGLGFSNSSHTMSGYRVYVEGIPAPIVPDYSVDTYTDLVPMSGLTSADSVAVSLDAAAGSYLNCTTNSGDHRNFVPLTSGMATAATKFYGCGSITYNTSTYPANAASHCSYVPLAKLSAGSDVYYLVLQFYGAGAQARFGVITPTSEHNYWRFDYIGTVTTNIGDTHAFKYALDTDSMTLSLIIDDNLVLEDFDITSKFTPDSMIPLAGLGFSNSSHTMSGYRVYVEGTPSDLIPDYSEEKYADILPVSGLATADQISAALDSENGSTLVCIINSGSHRNFVDLTPDTLKKAPAVYGSGSIRYNTSSYPANAAGHCSLIPLAHVTYNGDTEGYLVMEFFGNSEQARFAFVYPGVDTAPNVWRLQYMSPITTAIGDSHTFKYAVDFVNNTVSILIDGYLVVDAFDLTAQNMVLDNATVGLGFYYSAHTLSNYRVYACAHNNTEVIDAVAASCTKLGYSGETYCLDCGQKIADGETVPMTAHTVDNWITDENNHWHFCTVCENKVDEAAHIESNWIIDIPATIEAVGHRHKECTVCQYLLAEEDTEKLTHIAGDINNDTEVNNKDLTRLLQYLTGCKVTVDENALDVNGDNAVNNKDLIRLFKYLSGCSVEIF